MLQFHMILPAATQPWNVTLEAAFAARKQISGVFIESDGSYFFSSPPGQRKWRVEGRLYDQ